MGRVQTYAVDPNDPATFKNGDYGRCRYLDDIAADFHQLTNHESLDQGKTRSKK